MTEVGSPPHILVFKNLGVNDTLLKQNYYIPARSSSHLRRYIFTLLEKEDTQLMKGKEITFYHQKKCTFQFFTLLGPQYKF